MSPFVRAFEIANDADDHAASRAVAAGTIEPGVGTAARGELGAELVPARVGLGEARRIGEVGVAHPAARAAGRHVERSACPAAGRRDRRCRWC